MNVLSFDEHESAAWQILIGPCFPAPLYLFSKVGTPSCGVPAPFRRGTRVGCKPFRPLHAGGDIAARCPYPQQDAKHLPQRERATLGASVSSSPNSDSRAPDIAALFSRFPVIFCESEGGEGGPKPVRFFGRCFSMAGYGHYS